MTGTKIPVLNIEKLRMESGGRGVYIDDDATNFDVSTWSTGVSGGAAGAVEVLPAASAAAWWKVTDGTTSYYIPLFTHHW